jgi:hypothetical protein
VTLLALVTLLACRLASAALMCEGRDSCAAAAFEVPRAYARVGESIITTRQRDAMAAVRLRPLARLRESRLASRLWTEDDEARWRECVEAGRSEAERGLLTEVLIREIVLARGYRPRMVEGQIWQMAGRRGGLDRVCEEAGISPLGLRDRVVADKCLKQFQSTLLPAEVPPGPEAVRRYYEEHPGKSRTPDLVRVRMIAVSSDPAINPPDVTRRPPVERARWLAAEARRDPGRFEELAREHSAEGSAARGGLMTGPDREEWIPLPALAPRLAEAVRGLAPGQVSDVIEDRDGFVIIKLEGLRPGEVRPLAAVADAILEAIFRERQEKTLEDWEQHYLEEVYREGLGERGASPGGRKGQ